MDEFTLKRTIPMEDEYDVIVAGGGPAGVAAAVTAQRMGRRVLLAEAMGCLGGLGTSGMVGAFGPMSDGVRRLARGFIGEVVDRMYERGWIREGLTPELWNAIYMKWTAYNCEGLKIIYDEFIKAAGVEVRFFTKVIDADLDPGDSKRVNGVILHNIEGYRYIKAKAFVDATGDAVLANLCGVECREAYRDTPVGLPATLVSIWAGIDWEEAQKHTEEHQALLEKAFENGRFTVTDRQFGVNHTGKTIGYLNAGHLFGVNALNNKSVTEALIWGRKQLLEYRDFLNKDLPGFSKAELVATAPLLGNRESRRIVGEEEITKEDFFAKRQFFNQIGVYNRFMDIHPYNASKEEWERFRMYWDKNHLGSGNCLGIPYGILVPKGWKNLWVAGRCVSSDNQVLGTIRAQPCCSIMGQAAGAATVQAITTGQEAYRLDTEALRDVLRKQGVYIP
jgi:hypothetical protein